MLYFVLFKFYIIIDLFWNEQSINKWLIDNCYEDYVALFKENNINKGLILLILDMKSLEFINDTTTRRALLDDIIELRKTAQLFDEVSLTTGFSKVDILDSSIELSDYTPKSVNDFSNLFPIEFYNSGYVIVEPLYFNIDADPTVFSITNKVGIDLVAKVSSSVESYQHELDILMKFRNLNQSDYFVCLIDHFKPNILIFEKGQPLVNDHLINGDIHYKKSILEAAATSLSVLHSMV